MILVHTNGKMGVTETAHRAGFSEDSRFLAISSNTYIRSSLKELFRGKQQGCINGFLAPHPALGSEFRSAQVHLYGQFQKGYYGVNLSGWGVQIDSEDQAKRLDVVLVKANDSLQTQSKVIYLEHHVAKCS